MQLDHLFILVSPGAPEAQALTDFGLVEGSSNEHPGQGTANRRFFLANTTLELLYVHDIAEAINGPGKNLRLVERAIEFDGSPFGLVTRVDEQSDAPTFASWQYYPDYFPKPMSFYVGTNSDNFFEPLCICMPPSLPRPKKAPAPSNSGWSLTELQISIPAPRASAVLKEFGECNLVTLRYNEEHRIKLVFNNAVSNESKDFMPDLPLVIEW